MCRNIKTLNNFEPAATQDEVRAAATQFVRKVAGTSRPSAANVAVFERAVADVSAVTERLLADLVTPAPKKDRAAEAVKAKERSRRRFAPSA